MISPCPSMFFGPALQAEHVPLLQAELGGILDGHDPLVVRDRLRERVQQRRLAGSGASRDQDVQLRADAELEELRRLFGQRAGGDEVVEIEPLVVELPDRDERSGERQRRNDRVHAAAVGEPGVDHRRGLVDSAADLADHLVDDPAQMRLVVEGVSRPGEPAVALQPDVVGPVDHDLADGVVGEQRLDRPVGENVRLDLVVETRPVVARQAGLLGQALLDRRHHTVLQDLGVSARVVELRTELADDRQVEPGLQLGERVDLPLVVVGLGRVRCLDPLVEFHCPTPSSAEPSDAVRETGQTRSRSPLRPGLSCTWTPASGMPWPPSTSAGRRRSAFPP